MISLAGRDILHSWAKFVFTGIGLGLLIGVTLTMAGVYRGMVDDARALLTNSGADLWVVQQDTQGPYAESSSLRDDAYRALLGMPGVARAANVTYFTMQVRRGTEDVRAMVVGMEPGQPGEPGYLVAGRHITRNHYEAVADVKTGFAVGDRIRIRRHDYQVVGLTQRMVSSGGDPMVFIPLADAQEAQFLKDNDASSTIAPAPPPTRHSTARVFRACWRPCRRPRAATTTSTPCWCSCDLASMRSRWPGRSGAGSTWKCSPEPRWKTSWWPNSLPPRPSRSACSS